MYNDATERLDITGNDAIALAGVNLHAIIVTAGLSFAAHFLYRERDR